MLLALLAGCGCPSFDDLPIVDPDGVGTDEEHDAVQEAIDTFAAWTGREGVCVDRIEIDEELEWRPEASAGAYVSGDPVGHIYLETGGAVLRGRALHELCHALDHDEALSDAHPEIFPPAEGLDPVLYTGEAKLRHETFARTCVDGPREFGLARALEAACGVSTVDPIDRFLADDVFLGHADLPVAVDAFTAEEGAAVEVTLPPGAWLYSVIGDTDGLLLLTITWRYVAYQPFVAYATVLRVSLPDGAVVASWRVPFTGIEDLRGGLYRGDGGPAVFTVVDERGRWQTYTLDEATGAFTALPLDAPIDAGGVSSGGVFWYVSEADGERVLRGVDLATGGATGGVPLPTAWTALWDGTPDGTLVAWQNDAIGLLDPVTGTFSALPDPGSDGFVGFLDADRMLFRASDGTVAHDQRLDGYAIYDRAADTWALSADPCHDDGASLTVAAAGGHWVLRKRQVEDTQILVLRPLSLSE